MKDFLARRVMLPVWALVIVGVLLLGIGASSGSTDENDAGPATTQAVAIENQLPYAVRTTSTVPTAASPATTVPPSMTTVPTTAAPTTVAMSPPTAQKAPATATTTLYAPPTPAPSPTTYYANCSAARSAGAAPVRRGDPGFAPHLDRDNDGVGCE
ncbi:MAG: excalibur calcium-binding domain-containing protein [Acidimicrobiia bacterium]